MKRYSSWVFIFILIFHISGFSQDSTKYLTIKQCVDLAIKNNLLVQTKRNPAANEWCCIQTIKRKFTTPDKRQHISGNELW